MSVRYSVCGPEEEVKLFNMYNNKVNEMYHASDGLEFHFLNKRFYETLGYHLEDELSLESQTIQLTEILTDIMSQLIESELNHKFVIPHEKEWIQFDQLVNESIDDILYRMLKVTEAINESNRKLQKLKLNFK